MGGNNISKAVVDGDYSKVNRLLDAGADTEYRHKGGSTPLLLACERQNFDMMQLLLLYKANIEATDSRGWTPLLLLCKKSDNLPWLKRIKLVDLLLENKANVEVSDGHGDTALITAIENNFHMTVKSLLGKKANIEAADENGMTPLSRACEMRYFDIDMVDSLLFKKANIEATDSRGWTPLLCACSTKYPSKVVKCLLENKANVEATSTGAIKWTPLRMATAKGKLLVVQKLLDWNANPLVKGDFGSHYPSYNHDALEIAKRDGFTEVVDFWKGNEIPKIRNISSSSSSSSPQQHHRYERERE